MPYIQPSNSAQLTYGGVEYANLYCCGDVDLVFLRCPACGHLGAVS